VSLCNGWVCNDRTTAYVMVWYQCVSRCYGICCCPIITHSTITQWHTVITPLHTLLSYHYTLNHYTLTHTIITLLHDLLSYHYTLIHNILTHSVIPVCVTVLWLSV
jgi:hypothetical protein